MRTGSTLKAYDDTENLILIVTIYFSNPGISKMWLGRFFTFKIDLEKGFYLYLKYHLLCKSCIKFFIF